MKETGIFFLYLLACLLVAAALTPPVLATGLVEVEPHRLMSRLAQAIILLGCWPFLRWRGVAERGALGLAAPAGGLGRAVAGGWLTGVAMLAALALALIALEIRVPDLPQGWTEALARRALQALAGGLVIGLLEEAFFRGALYGAIRRRGSPGLAIVGSALLYALVHFMKPHALPQDQAFDWVGVGTMLLEVFTGVLQWRHLDSLVALFVAGVFLALVREQRGHIGWCIGLHAGWVFVIQVTRAITDGNPASPLGYLVGDYDGMIGWLGAAWIAVLSMGLLWLRPAADRRMRSDPDGARRTDIRKRSERSNG